MTTSRNSNIVSTAVDGSRRRGMVASIESLLQLEDVQPPEIQPGVGSAVLYLRVSDPRQLQTSSDIDVNGNSIATQQEFTRRYARENNIPIVEEFVEPGRSGRSINKRPSFRDMLYFIEEHPEVRYVIIYQRSRMFRNQADAALTTRILANMGVALVSATENFGTGPMAWTMTGMSDLMNEAQVVNGSSDISSKMLHKAMRGGTTGRARIGYLNVRKDVDGYQVNSIDIDPKRGPLVRWAFEQYATGEYSVVRLQQELADQGFTTRRTAKWEERVLSRSQLSAMLRDPYYTGMLPYKGQLYEGRHEALVSHELFEQVQAIIDSRMQRTQRDITHNHFLRGMLLCGRCEANGRRHQLVYSQARNSSGDIYEYYRCVGRQDKSCDLPHLPIALVEHALHREVQSLRLSAKVVGEMRDQVSKQLDRRVEVEREARARIRKELAALNVKEERLIDFVADGSMTSGRVRERLNRIQVQRHSLAQRLEAANDHIDAQSATILRYLDLLEKPGSSYSWAKENVKRRLLKAYYARIWIDDDGFKVVPETEQQPIVAQIEEAARRGVDSEEPTELLLGGLDTVRPGLLSQVVCSNKDRMVPQAGIEPATVRLEGGRSIR